MSKDIKVLKHTEVIMPGYGSIMIEEDFSGDGYKILIDTLGHSKRRVWIGFNDGGNTCFMYWEDVQEILKDAWAKPNRGG
jgi:hypothetical protein